VFYAAQSQNNKETDEGDNERSDITMESTTDISNSDKMFPAEIILALERKVSEIALKTSNIAEFIAMCEGCLLRLISEVDDRDDSNVFERLNDQQCDIVRLCMLKENMYNSRTAIAILTHYAWGCNQETNAMSKRARELRRLTCGQKLNELPLSMRNMTVTVDAQLKLNLKIMLCVLRCQSVERLSVQ
jgi:hypothetical protein